MDNFNPNKIIKTERLVIRFTEERDAEDLCRNIFSDKEVLKYFVAEYAGTPEEIHLDKMIESAMKGKRYFMSVVLKETNEVIGIILWCSRPYYVYKNVELGYAFGQNYWHKGYATEALKAVIDFTFESSDVHKIVCQHLEGNDASKRVMERCGMLYEGTHKDEIFYHDEYFNTYQYYLINPKDKEA